MKSRISFLALAAGLALAQGPHGPGGGSPQGTHSGTAASNLVMTKLQTVTGTVTAVNVGYRMQYPSVIINKTQVKIGPVWYLLEKNLEIKSGDNLSIVAAPSTVANDPYLYAVEITNNATKAHLILRDGSGVPLWTQNGGRGGPSYGLGPMADGDCTGVQSIATESGVIEQISAGAGIQMPTLMLKTVGGKLLAIKLGPERLLLDADLELKVGESITVHYAVTSHDDELVALSITAGGKTVVLRTDDGRPAWMW